MAVHLFAERFCLMWYACSCGHRERVWNSRNGVTPFGLSCTSCDPGLRRSANHTDWHLDVPVEKHVLIHGQRFFRDGTPEEAVAIIERRARRSFMPEDIKKCLIEDAKYTRGEWNVGWPSVDRYDAYNTEMVEKYKGQDLR
jgi:hypothetical protein